MPNVVKREPQTKTVISRPQTKAVNSKINLSMDTGRLKYNRSPVETPNGTITIFTLPDSDTYVSGLIDVFLDGLQQIKTTDYSESSSSTITMVTAPATGEVLRLNYVKQ